MGKCFLMKSGGGGSIGTELNFTIVGGTIEPSAPMKNTIWVNTDVEIADWTFSADEPTTLVEGMVWFTVGISSSAQFNALSKNELNIYPLSAKQYVSGTWVNVTAKSYQGGEWVDWWNGELYSLGNEYEIITGGWSSDGNGTLTKSGAYMKIKPTPSVAATINVMTANTVDFSSYNTLRFDVSGSGKWTDIYLGAVATDGSFIVSRNIGGMIATITISRSYYDVDVSGVTGKYTPIIRMYNGADPTPVELSVYNIKLE